ncbi:hypothetical protein PV328_008593 [Microctonus aethiopoides]|uniref:Uncharacterized protein n=1 Tax=Microctonus aethiopoides TaxID=144406 RepID=A0AA39FJW6_9HYME|nr:hypothetical protein PV328_008593 [Microctonus aethiopoides]
MANMESYISCIKIRGTPILPPLMTDDRRMEMNYYKKLALAVENRLSNLRLTDKVNSEVVKLDEINDDETSDVDKKYSKISTEHTTVSNEFCGSEINSKSIDDERKITSDEETITISTDINKFINNSDSSKTDVTETISDLTKPSVPTTLDIIPITMDLSNMAKSGKSSSEIEELEGEIPKLIRQGSYTLDTPSPMLLAHLVEHSADDYVPTAMTNGVNKREWNMIDGKTEWKYQRVTPDSIKRPSSSENEIYSNRRRNSISGCENSRGGNKFSRGKIGRQSINTKHYIVKSVDCIPTILSKEHTSVSPKDQKSNIPIKKYLSNNRYMSSDNQKLKMNKNIPNVNLIHKFGGSLGTLSNQSSMSNKKRSQLDNNRMTKSFDMSSTPKCKLSNSPDKLKPSIVSDKLIHVFKEIQKTHEHQMADLVARQQKEQIIMQQEFQKQQLLLLSKIEESFPGVSLPLLAKNIPALSIDNRLEGQNYSSYNSISLSKSEPNRSDPEISPINGSSFESDESISLNCNVSTQNRSFACSNMSCERRKSNVSRELFPLDSSRIDVLVTNGFIHEDKHIKAATIINAYARGYFVRRLMKTERVVTLKNTYKEALHCMLKLHVDAPLELAELNFHKRLQHQCDAASISIVELFAQDPRKLMEIISHDRQIKKSRQERPNSARSSYSFATQRTLARKRIKELGIVQLPDSSRSINSARTRCQTWTSNSREKRSPGIIYQGIKRSTSAGAVRKPWR